MTGKLIKVIFSLLSLLSLRNAQSFGRFIGGIAWKLDGRSVQTTRKNLRACYPDLREEEIEAMGRQSLRETGATALELPLMWEWPVERCLGLIREIEGEELLSDYQSGKQGLLLLAPHLGNWELTGLFFASRYQMAALYSPPNQAGFEAYMKAVRSRSGSELVATDRRGIMRLFSILREGGVVGILPDQTPRREGGDFAPFFGIPTITMTLATKLIHKTGAKPLVTYAQRLPDAQGFKIVIREAEPGMASKDMTESLTALNRSVEKCIADVPTQYQWEYKRFRRTAPGEMSVY
ncbi:lysophospholipid acyltransferase family protein [Marinobacter halophilus]|uniref:Lipid A biosynthesis acyltransferase n=1 Tax=Marinobacter halophilus TaxID=1323740 RepID=A0A2T1KG48_9GAMM|nr:lysophospholipid acyltransferase family protein [Marinobacter halophilus]PSF09099.1 lipid A biosynthesis acyltransferase [Marinobacter halophilus]GGC83406.1 lipid A biosynthesis lauroyl acyltransferase [Marinobacter halophilus]